MIARAPHIALHLCTVAALGSAMPCAAAAQNAPVRKLVPEVTISGEANDILTVTTFVRAPNGNVLVLGRGANRGKAFSPEGKLIRNFGRQGQGPGELASERFSYSGMLGDTLWVYDGGTARIAMFSSTGERVGEVPYRRGGGAWNAGHPEWSSLSSSLYPLRLLPGGAAIALPSLDLAPLRASSIAGHMLPLIRMTWEGRVQGSPLTLPLEHEQFRLKPPRAGRTFEQLFAHLPRYAFSGDGRRLVFARVRDGAQPSVELVHIATTGDTIATLQVPFTPDPIRRGTVDSVIAEWLEPAGGRTIPGYVATYAGGGPEMRDSLIVPAYFRPFGEVMLANDGTTWLQWHVPGNNRQWLVVSPRGEVVMQVEQPEAVTLRSVDGTVWGTKLDDVGFIDLIRFAIAPR